MTPHAATPAYDRARLQAMANRHPALLWISDTTGMCTDFNMAWLEFRGRTREEEYGTGWLGGVHPDDSDACMATYLRHFEERTPFEMEYRLQRADGEYRLILDAGAPWYLEDGAFAGFVGSCLDITDHVAVRRGLARAEETYRTTLEALHDGVIVIDASGQVVSVNPAAERLLGEAAERLIEQPLRAIGDRLEVIGEDGGVVAIDQQPAMRALRSGEPVVGEVLGWQEPGRGLRWHLVTSRPVHEAGEERPVAVVTSFVDITDQKLAADQDRYLARHDPLTGLANRAALHARVEQVRAGTPRTGVHLAVVFCDVDGFKSINDRVGHAAGDHVLQQVAARIRETVRAGDFVARVGGDEVVVLLEQVDGLAGAIAAAETIRSAVARPVVIGDASLVPTLSAGVAIVHPDEDVDRAISRADEAMYVAKEAGRDRVATLES